MADASILPLSRPIAEAVISATPDGVPEATWDYLKCCVADAVGVAFASRQFDYAARTSAAMVALSGGGPSRTIAGNERLSIRDAALLNGVLIHGLDYDDTHLESVIHCSASALPTALAIASERPVSGSALLMAVLLAIEVDARVGSAAGGTFQQLGFHPTGVVGLFGAVLAAVRLRGGSVDDAVRAQGIALSTTSGSMAFLDDGSWTKRLHPGWAASSAITAATLAMAGFESPEEAYAGRFGLYSLFTRNAGNANNVAWDLVNNPWALSDVAIKPYPICHFNHAAIDSALALREQYGLSVGAIKRGQILLHERQFAVVVDPIERKRRPDSEYEAKFSAPYGVAAALVLGQFGLTELDESSRCDPDILALAERLDCKHDDRSIYPNAFSGGLRLELTDGRIIEHFDVVNRGAAGRLLTAEDVKKKFTRNCQLTTTEQRAEAIWQAIMHLDEQVDCSGLLELLALPAASESSLSA